MLGLTAADVADQLDIEMWPDTEPAISLFIDLSTQWRTGMGGATGLDYAAIPAVLDLRGIDRAQRSDLFDDLRVMEAETLRLLDKDRKK